MAPAPVSVADRYAPCGQSKAGESSGAFLPRISVVTEPTPYQLADLGPEAPAVVNLLVDGRRVTSAAVAATLVDLAARRVVSLEEVGPERFVVRVRAGADRSDLTRHETQVLQLVDDRAAGGSAPVDVLRQAAGASDQWLRTFGDAVVRDAEAQGLVRRGLSRGERIALIVLGVVLGIGALALTIANPGGGDNSGGWFAAALIVWVAVAMARGRTRTVHLTPGGEATRNRWRGLREQLAANPTFADQPPAAVAIWGRVLAYGVALGVNRAAATALAVTDPDPEWAWTRERGTWQLVRVRTRHRFGAGEFPRVVFTQGLVRLVGWAAMGFFVFPVALRIVWDGVDAALVPSNGVAGTVIVAVVASIVAVVVVAIAFRIYDGVVRTWRGWNDLHHTTVIEGRVVQVAGQQFAVDDGRSPTLIGFVPPSGLVPRLGQRVRVAYTPNLHHVEKIEHLDARTGSGEPEVVADDPEGTAP